jgi:hypothetical protein
MDGRDVRKGSTTALLLWALGGAIIGAAAGFAIMFLGLRGDGPRGLDLLLSKAFAAFTAAVGGGIGAVVESIVHARRK